MWRGLVAEALPRGSRVADVEVLADRLLKRPDVLAMASVGREARSATPRSRCWRIERSLLDAARRLRHDGRGMADRADLVEALDHFPSALRRAGPDGRLPHELGGRRRSRGGQGRGRQDLGPRGGTDVVGIERLPCARHRAVGPGGPRTARRGRHRVADPGLAAGRHRVGPDPARRPRRRRPRRGRHGGHPGAWPTCRVGRRRRGQGGPRRRSPPAARDRSRWSARRLDRSGRCDRAQREPAPAVVVGARRPRRIAHGASQRGPRNLRACRARSTPHRPWPKPGGSGQVLGRVVPRGPRRRNAGSQPPGCGHPQRAGAARSCAARAIWARTWSRWAGWGSPGATR